MPWSEYLRRWSMEDRSIVVAVQLERADKCQGCGLTEREFLEDPDAFVPMQVVCPWCAMKDRVRSDSDTDQTIPGARVQLVPKRVAEMMARLTSARPKSRRERARER